MKKGQFMNAKTRIGVLLPALENLWGKGQLTVREVTRAANAAHKERGGYEVVYTSAVRDDLDFLVKKKFLEKSKDHARTETGFNSLTTVYKTVNSDVQTLRNILLLYAQRKCLPKRRGAKKPKKVGSWLNRNILILEKAKESLEMDLKEMKEKCEQLEEKLEDARLGMKKTEMNGISSCPKCHFNIKKYGQRIQDIIKECEV